jgi:hypothetical protein
MAVPAHPYPFALDEPLLWWSEAYPWTIRDACEGTQIFGDVGSGKTTGSGRTIARAFLRAGYGGLILCKKTDEAANWIQYARETGRSEQLLIINPHQRWRFNFLQYTFERSGEGAGHVQNAVELFMSVIENRRDTANQAAHEQRFFLDGVRRLLRNGMETLLLAGEPVTIDGLMRLFSSTPYPHPQTGAPVWPRKPASDEFLARSLAKATFRYRRGLAIDVPTQAHPDDLQSYFLREFARSGANRQSAGILGTFTGMAEPYLSGPIRELFCTTTNFLPAEFSRKGAIIILDLPLDEYEEIGRTAALTLKYIWQRGILRRQGLKEPGDVPVFLWADEAQNFITPADPKFMNECRSSVCATVFLTQNINNYMSSFHVNSEALTNSLLAGMNTKIAHRNGDYRTNQWFAETCAKGRTIFYSGGTSESRGMSENMSWGSSSGGGSSAEGASSSYSSERGGSRGFSRERSTNEGWSEQMEFQVQPEIFTRLKSGGPQNGNEVQAVIFKSGATFPPTGKPFTGVTFKQS